MPHTEKHNKAVYYDLLQNELDNKSFILPYTLKNEYSPIFVVRVARYDPSSHSTQIEASDFFSQVQIMDEKGAKNIDVLKEYWGNYSCSCFVCSPKIKSVELPIDFVDVEDLSKKLSFDGLTNLLNAMKLPRKNKKRAILIGKVNPICGTIAREGSHIHWFIYKDANPQDYFSEWGVIYEKVGKSDKRGRIEHRKGAD